MADPARLHSEATHIFMRIFAGLWGCMAALTIVQNLIGQRQPFDLMVIATFMLGMTVVYQVFWHTHRVFIDGDHLLIGRGPGRPRIDFADVRSCEYPWWVFSARFCAPMQLTLRNGATVTFFPADGAADLIAARRRQAQQQEA